MNREAFAERVHAMQDKLYRIASGQLRGMQDREDAVQEAIFKAWKMREALRHDEYFETWLIRILINECHNIQRAGRRILPVEHVPEPAQADRSDRLADLREAIWALDQRMRTPVVLHYIEGYSTKEIAQIMRLPQGTVCSRLKRARAALKEFLGEEETGRGERSEKGSMA